MTDYDSALVTQLSGELTRELRERQAITCPHRAECNWSSPDTCRACRGEKPVLVLAVDTKGIKEVTTPSAKADGFCDHARTIMEGFDRDIPHWYVTATVGGKTGRTIADVGQWTDRPNAPDDARLIAAAPAMYEALKAILDAAAYGGTERLGYSRDAQARTALGLGEGKP